VAPRARRRPAPEAMVVSRTFRIGQRQRTGAIHRGEARMISEEENKILTGVGPGTPGGELLRRYWYPIAVTSELDHNPTKRVRLLGEDLILYRDRSGSLGLIEPQCAHRRVDLFYG